MVFLCLHFNKADTNEDVSQFVCTLRRLAAARRDSFRVSTLVFLHFEMILKQRSEAETFFDFLALRWFDGELIDSRKRGWWCANLFFFFAALSRPWVFRVPCPKALQQSHHSLVSADITAFNLAAAIVAHYRNQLWFTRWHLPFPTSNFPFEKLFISTSILVNYPWYISSHTG